MQLLSFQDVVLRKEAGGDVRGHLVVTTVPISG
jgi:hypothetical protein